VAVYAEQVMAHCVLVNIFIFNLLKIRLVLAIEDLKYLSDRQFVVTPSSASTCIVKMQYFSKL
jgi:hypothetical protein